MNKTPCIIVPYYYPNSKLNIIFENKDKEKYDNASLFQDILKYANDKSNLGFKFTQLGNCLIKKNKEFVDFYSGSKAHTRLSARIANKRQRIQNCIDNLEKWDLLRISKMVAAEKNDIETPLYIITPLGKLVSLIVKAKFSNDEEKKDAIKEIIDIAYSIKKYNDSAIVLFITKLLNQLWENNKETKIIEHFDRLLRLELNSGNDFLSSLLGIKHFIYWFLVDEKISFEILENLPEDKRKIILINLKTEIEYYYQQNYLLKDVYMLKNKCLPCIIINNFNYGDLINNRAIPSAYWENIRIKFIDSFSKVVVPSYCNLCDSHRAFVVDIIDYLKSIVKAHSLPPDMHVSGNCIECRSLLSTHVISLPFGFLAGIRRSPIIG